MKLLVRFVQRYQALWAEGFLGYVGFAKETTAGTPVAATDYFEIMSENVTEAIARFPTRNAFGGFYEPDDYAGARSVAGDIVMTANAVSIGHFLKMAFNTISGSVVASGALYLSNFISTKSNFAAGVPGQPGTFEIFRDTGSSYQMSYGQANRLQLSLATNGPLMATLGLLGKAVAIIAKTSPTFVTSPADPFTWDTASISIGGSATSRLEAFNLSVNNNFSPILALNASNQLARVRRTAPQEVRIGGTLDFIDQAELDDFKAQTERRFTVNLFRANSFNMFIDAPRFVYSTFPTGTPGRDRLTIGFEGIAKYHTGSGVAVSVGLTSTKSNY